jgi:CRISPR-associated protein Cas5d
MKPSVQTLEVWGELACFTRPEMKVERFSYPVMTPSAARAVYEAIYWKPQFRWQVTRIEVLSQPRYIALRRNEVKGKAPSDRTIGQWRGGKAEPQPLWADGGDEATGRTQRQTMALKDVKYRLHATVQPWPEHADNLPAFEAQFRRRAQRGQCIYQPYLGCREFPAYFRLVEQEQPQPGPIVFDLDLGLMLYDVFDLSRPGTDMDMPAISIFHAQVRDGVMQVPNYSDDAVLKCVGEGQPC